MRIEVSSKNIRFFEALASETRIKMIELLRGQPMNMKELAEKLDISPAVVTKHAQLLERAGIISCKSLTARRGTQKICSLLLDQAHLQFKSDDRSMDQYTVSIPVGQYTSYQVTPTCGLATPEKIIGKVNDPRYFADPEHVHASIIWFGSGYVAYRIPNFVLVGQTVRSLEISLEICSEAHRHDEQWPSDISFYINDVCLGTWTCPGDFGGPPGLYNPPWWTYYNTQHGLLKTITVTGEMTVIDGEPLSQVTMNDLNIEPEKELLLKIAVHEDAKNCRGVNIFGKHFGNYNQDILVTMHY
ncbi:ArsR/SmtB family transcription factor [Paenibacillus sp. GYB003]|uniref:ArsR/SmtB family transcription factor n=1 Tax=Paenibacillus sp. GYB003 TaxID=2994392 RepID=UPI002F96E64A